MKKFFLLLISILFFSVGFIHAEDSSSEKKEEVEFPQWALDLRRAEIVGFGSMPFTTMGVTFFYGAYKYFSGESSSFPNPFDKNTSYEKKEIFSILGISFGISALIALSDFIIVKIERGKNRDRLKRLQTTDIITVVPASEEEIIKFRNQQIHGEDSAPDDSNPDDSNHLKSENSDDLDSDNAGENQETENVGQGGEP